MIILSPRSLRTIPRIHETQSEEVVQDDLIKGVFHLPSCALKPE